MSKINKIAKYAKNAIEARIPLEDIIKRCVELNLYLGEPVAPSRIRGIVLIELKIHTTNTIKQLHQPKGNYYA